MCWPARTTCRCSPGSARIRPNTWTTWCGRRQPAGRDCWSSRGRMMASMVPVELHPLLWWRRRDLGDGPWGARRLIDHPGLMDDVLAVIAENGPISAGQVERLLELGRGPGGWWGWSATKIACEVLFASGAISTATRSGFERFYDLTERVVPAAVLVAPQRAGGRRQARAGRARRPPARGGHRRRPGRLLSHAGGRDTFCCRRSGCRRHPRTGGGGRLAGAGLPARRDAPAAPAGRRGAVVPVRPADLVPPADRAFVRLPLPDRDLHARRTSGSTATT